MLIPLDYSQVNLIFTSTGLPTGAECTFAVDNAGGATPAAIAAAVDAGIVAHNINDYWVPSLILESILVKNGPNATGASALVASGIGGTGAGDPDSPNVSVLLHKVTGSGGRTGRGRMYIPGVPTAQVSPAGILNTTYVDGVTAAWNAFRVAMDGIGHEPVLLHAPGSPVTDPIGITSFECDQRVATQRRRLRR